MPPQKGTEVGDDYYGFTKPAPSTQTIAQDGSTVVNYYYTRNSYQVTFDLQGHGGTSPQPMFVKFESTVNAPEVPKDDVYHFNGWFKDEACTIDWNFFADKVTKNVTLYAK